MSAVAWLLESGWIAVIALAITAVEFVILLILTRRREAGDILANLISGAALMALVGLALAGLATWPTVAGLLLVAFAAHAVALALRFG
jgi:hypothetical protein